MGSTNSKRDLYYPFDTPEPTEKFIFPNQTYTIANKTLHRRDHANDTSTSMDRGAICSIAEVIIDKEKFTLIQYTYQSRHVVVYYDNKFNYVKSDVYPIHCTDRHKLKNVFVINDKILIIVTADKLILHEQDKYDTLLFESHNEWFYKIDNNKIIVSHKFIYEGSNISFSMRILDADKGYTYTETKYLVNSLLKPNLIYLYILPQHILKFYNSHIRYIVHVEYVNNKYRIIFSYATYLQVVECEDPDEGKIKSRTILQYVSFVDCYKINVLLNKSILFFPNPLNNRDGDNIGCILPENYDLWYKRMIELLKSIYVIDKISADLLRLIVDYVS